MYAATQWWSPAGLSGMGLAVLLAAVAGAFFVGTTGRRRPLEIAAVSGVTFQVVHFIEHGAQVTYWLLNPASPPWLTPWADVARDGLAYWCQLVPGAGGAPLRGVEVLHLVGNLLFLGGAMAVFRLIAERGLPGRSSARWCLNIQGIHVIEHVLLTSSVFLTGRSMGLSTLFGTLDPTATGAIAYRVLFHFFINLAATFFVVRAGKQATGWRLGLPRPHLAGAAA